MNYYTELLELSCLQMLGNEKKINIFQFWQVLLLKDVLIKNKNLQKLFLKYDYTFIYLPTYYLKKKKKKKTATSSLNTHTPRSNFLTEEWKP